MYLKIYINVYIYIYIYTYIYIYSKTDTPCISIPLRVLHRGGTLACVAMAPPAAVVDCAGRTAPQIVC